MYQISDSELIVMRIIWNHNDTAMYADVMSYLTELGMTWKKNTVLTFLSRLVEKGVLKARKIGHRNEYIVAVTEREYQAKQTEKLISKVYEGNVESLLSNLLEQGLISSEEMQKICKDSN